MVLWNIVRHSSKCPEVATSKLTIICWLDVVGSISKEFVLSLEMHVYDSQA